MIHKYNTEQENFWAGEFGDIYINRNKSSELMASNIHFWGEIISNTHSLNTILELGANVGMNIKAINHLLPNAKLSAVEINENAYNELMTIPGVEGYHQSIFDFSTSKQYDMTFVKGVLIHLNPDLLNDAYDKLYAASRKYVCIAEYYNPSPVALPYRGHEQKLFKRDFAGEFMQRHLNTRLVKYGFSYHKDPVFPQDDITWFLIEKLENSTHQ
ncbi:MAG: pseudaminic acid biosynthesis-associated methylase [Flavobacterium sp.]|nr:MAG: pseudaminic acid biosynthesis-associated methylase [Flavobacterium sp.]